MAEMKFFNYATAVKDAETIQNARMTNAINSYKLEEAQNVMAKRKERDQIVAQHADTPARIKALVDAGQYDGAKELAENFYAIDEARLTLAEQQAKFLNKDNWDDWRYQQIHSNGVPAWEIPENYDPGYMNTTIKGIQQEIKTVEQILGEDKETGEIMARSITRTGDGGREVSEPYSLSQANRARSRSGTDPYDTPESNVIIKAVRNRFGSTIDPATNQFRILDPDVEDQIVAVQARVEQYVDDQNMPLLQAVQKALEDYNVDIPAPPAHRDSGGLRARAAGKSQGNY